MSKQTPQGELESRARELFADALEKDPSARERYVADRCGPDRALADRAIALLRAFLKADPVIATVAAAAPLPEPDAGAMIGPYRLLEIIGEGGFGIVWLAERREPMVQRVALKVIKPGMDSKAVIARFEQERQALAVMDHPSVARILDGGITQNGRPYFVMEHVAGEPITQFCDRHTFSIRQRLELFIPVCDAVQHAHLKGIIHRDLKPTNILVMLQDGRPVPKVIDFGVAKAINRTLTEKTVFTHVGALIGTPEYMSPEQAEMGRLDVDTRTDVYSLGVVLYELLTGLLPFDPRELRSKGFAEIQRIIREIDPPKPSTKLTTAGAPADGDRSSVAEIARCRRSREQDLVRQLRSELEWVPLKAMMKDRRERYGTPGALADDIRKYLAGEPLLAGPQRAAYRARKFLRRHKAPVAVAAALVLTLAAGAVGTTIFALRERAEHTRADQRAAEARAARDQAEAVTSFLAEILSGVEVSGKGADTRIRDILDAAGREAGQRFQSAPAVQARLRTTLTMSYVALGLLPEGEREATRAVDLSQAADGLPSADALTALAAVRLRQDKPDEALALLKQTVARRRQQPDQTQLPGDLHNLGLVFQRIGHLPEATALFREAIALETSAGAGGATPPAKNYKLRFALAAALAEAGTFGEAVPLAREALELVKVQRGTAHADYAVALCDAADVLRRAGHPEEAEPMLREALALQTGLWGKDHANVITTRRGLAAALRALNRKDEADALDPPPASPPASVAVVVEQARKLIEQGRAQDAVALVAGALKADEDKGGEPALDRASLRNSLAGARQAMLDFSGAIADYERGLALFEKLGQTERASACRYNLAATLLDAGDAPKAEPLARQSLEVYLASKGDRATETLEARRVLAAAQAHQDHAPEAAQELLGVVDLMASESRAPWRATRARSCLGEAQSLAGQKEQARELLCESYKALREMRGGSNAETRLAARRLARHFERCGDADSARAWTALFEDGSAPIPPGAGCE